MKPGTQPGFFGLFAWSAARLFVERATALGGRLTRDALIQDLRTVQDWTANGLHSTQQVGPKHTGDCWRFLQLQGGQWKEVLAQTGAVRIEMTGIAANRAGQGERISVRTGNGNAVEGRVQGAGRVVVQ